MIFEYLETIKRDAQIDIDIPGQACIQGYTDEGLVFYLAISTKMGFTTVKQFGPYEEDGKESAAFSYARYNFEYNETKVRKTIQDFLTGRIPKTQVFEIEMGEINDRLERTRL